MVSLAEVPAVLMCSSLGRQPPASLRLRAACNLKTAKSHHSLVSAPGRDPPQPWASWCPLRGMASWKALPSLPQPQLSLKGVRPLLVETKVLAEGVRASECGRQGPWKLQLGLDQRGEPAVSLPWERPPRLLGLCCHAGVVGSTCQEPEGSQD